MKGFIIYSTYRILNGKPCVVLYGRLENNESFITINEFQPYFFIETKDQKKANKVTEYKIEETNLKNFEENDMSKILIDLPKEVPHTRSDLENAGIKTYESDIKFQTKFLIDNKLQGSLEIEGDYDLTHETIDRIYKNPELKKTNYIPTNLKTFSFDIETDKKANIYCISAYSKNYKKSFIISKNKVKNSIICEDEKELLQEFQEELIKFDPDIITGWNVIDFDLKLLKEKFNKYKIPFILGRDNAPSKLRIESDFFRTSKADIPGRVVLDGLDLTKTSFIKLKNYKLDTAAKQLLGKGKLIDKLGSDKSKEIDRLYKEDKDSLIEYNLLDAELAYKIIYEADLLDLTIQRSLLTGMSLDRVNSSIASLDFLYLQRARENKLVCPSNMSGDREARIKGGYVMESKPGIYDNVIVLDFKSLYPSVIKTFNIDPSKYHEEKQKGDIESPNKAHFSNKEGILPNIIQDLWEEREKSRKNKNELGRYAIKILMNSFFGVLANPSCRFYNLNIANSITHFGQELIKLTAKKAEESKLEVIYSDTDSIFIDTKTEIKEESNKIGKKLEKEINDFYENYIQKEYKRKSFLELEYEKCYLRFLMPKLRGSTAGAKKRYAGLLENDKIEFVGLETVRSDWTKVAKEFQKELLDRVFHKKEVTNYIKKYVEDIQEGKKDKELIYRKSLRKDEKEYIKTTPPHVKAARKLEKIESSIIEYVLTTDGPEPIQNQKHKIDYEHYIKKQIKPIADTVLSFFDTNFEDVIKGTKQTSLFNFK
ncbi:DNA polymerase II [Candidatus Woesearchaeota archaeon]|jgi:DNA polymerase II|nr:DNA polymerase II [Candidatus Woesearchaeota archaeon]MBT7238214.1 DNA polymerase II [Candidatus Woesearchaeota archaeon]